MALEDSKFEVTEGNRRRIGVCFGTSAGKMEVFETEHLPFLERGVRALHPLSFVEFPAHGATSHVAIELNASGVCEISFHGVYSGTGCPLLGLCPTVSAAC